MLISLLFTLAAVAGPTQLPKDLEEFLGKAPPGFEKNYLKPAKQLRAALELRAHEKLAPAIAALQPLAQQGEYSEHATFELALALREKKEFAKSTVQAQRIMHEFPGSVYADRAPEMIRDNDCDLSLEESKKASGPRTRALLQRCLNRASWKEWAKREAQATALYQALSKAKDPLLHSFVAEIIQAMPAGSDLRRKVAQDFPGAKLGEIATLARYRMKNPNPAGVKAIQPDAELFDLGMVAVRKENWSEANATFKKFVVDFPQSERFDSANYWIARTDEKTGSPDAAKVRYEQIFAEGPLSYYGLQAGFRLKKDPKELIQAVRDESVKPKLSGTLLTRQAQSLWRLRGLIEAGLVEQAREEAKFFFQYRPSGSTFGQEDGLGALMVAKLYTAASYPLAAFSHAYSAVSLNPSLFTPEALGLIFPRNFEKDFLAAAETHGLHPDLLFSVAKQESAFIPNALSRADALGLLQLLPSTAQEMKSELKRLELFDPAVNTMLGAQYLRKLIDRFQGNIALALAGYNAGPSRAQQWQRLMLESASMKANFDIDTFIDSIPFTETRKYVSSILRNYAWYKLLENDGTIGSLQELAFQWQKAAKIPAKPSPPPATPEPQAELHGPEPEVPGPPPSPSTPKSTDTSAPTEEL